jgi:F-type H+-transporting ATPase subunit beta
MEGKVLQVLGPVIDVEFSDYLPAINEALEVEFEVEGKKKKVVLEVAAQIGDNVVRTIAMDLTDGLVRGTKVVATGKPISVPVGEVVLGRIFNVTGDVIDEGDPIPADAPRWSIHRDAPAFEDQSTKMDYMFPHSQLLTK